jgi:hypothetical protein
VATKAATALRLRRKIQAVLRRGDGELTLRLPVFRLLTRSASGERQRGLLSTLAGLYPIHRWLLNLVFLCIAILVKTLRNPRLMLKAEGCRDDLLFPESSQCSYLLRISFSDAPTHFLTSLGWKPWSNHSLIR